MKNFNFILYIGLNLVLSHDSCEIINFEKTYSEFKFGVFYIRRSTIRPYFSYSLDFILNDEYINNYIHKVYVCSPKDISYINRYVSEKELNSAKIPEFIYLSGKIN